MKIILHGDDLDGMVRAVREAIRFEQRDGRPCGGLLGIRFGDKSYSVKWTKRGLSVWCNK